jgi:hypothetical protein
LTSIATAKSTRDVTFIFTDAQSSEPTGCSAVQDYQDAAALRGSPLDICHLHCDLGENLKRAVAADRDIRGTRTNTKFTDLSILRMIRETEDIFHFEDGYEMELDVTRLSPGEAGSKIREHIRRVLQEDGTE